MADDMDLFDDLLGESAENKEKKPAKFKPKIRANAKPSKADPFATEPAQQSHVVDTLLNSDIDYVISPCSNSGTSSNKKGKLQPQRKPSKQSSPNIDEIEGLNQKNDSTFQMDTEANITLDEIDFLDDISLDPPPSVETTKNSQSEQIEKKGKGKKVTFLLPEEGQTLDPVPITSDKIHEICTPETGFEDNAENTENFKNTQNSDYTGEETDEAVPDLDSIFDFWDNSDPVPETDVNNNKYTEESEQRAKKDKETESSDKKPSRGRKRSSTDLDAIVEDESSNKIEKLSHKTRTRGRKRRQVDPSLLDIPDGEIDRRQISISNLILLAEAKEKNMIKDPNSKKPSHNQSSEPKRRDQDEFDFFDFDGDQNEKNQDDDEDADLSNEIPQPPPKKLNYHSYMNRSYNGRWSKLDTELFYKGIRQFGTDFEMIKHLFPDKTRKQIRDKFKNEDKKNPTLIYDAITHRLNDNSQYEKVIEILQIEPNKLSPEETNNEEETSSLGGEGKKEEQEQEQEEIEEENYKDNPEDNSNYSKHEEVANDDLDAIFDWD